MSDKIEETLRKIAAGTLKASSPNSSTSPKAQPRADMSGDPNCPICGGVGLLRADLPVGHPDFGKIQICPCRNQQVAQEVRQRLFSLSNLDQFGHLTFENFEARGRVGYWPNQAKSLEIAYLSAKRYAGSLKGWFFLRGGYGCGKSHLAAAIANFAVSLGVPTLFLTVPDMLDSLRFAYDDPAATFEDRFEQIRSAPLLILDDFGTQNATAWAQEKLFQIINFRYINRLPLVITTNLTLGEIEGRIRSRLEDDMVEKYTIEAPDYRNPAGDYGHPELSSLPLFNQCTFATFSTRKNEKLDAEQLRTLENALQAAREFAERPKGWLVLMGSYGVGKTHLAAAIGNFRADMGQPPLLVIVPDLLDHLRATFNPGANVTLDHRFEEVRTARLLILDDLGTQSMTPWVREKLYQLFNYRYNASLPTIITTADSLDEIDPRLRSRMLDRRLCRIVPIVASPFTGSIPEPKKPTAKRRSGG